MKVTIVPSSLINSAPFNRMDADYWVRVAERAKREGIALTDTEGMRRIQMTYAALYPLRAWPKVRRGLGELIEQAEQLVNEVQS